MSHCTEISRFIIRDQCYIFHRWSTICLEIAAVGILTEESLAGYSPLTDSCELLPPLPRLIARYLLFGPDPSLFRSSWIRVDLLVKICRLQVGGPSPGSS